MTKTLERDTESAYTRVSNPGGASGKKTTKWSAESVFGTLQRDTRTTMWRLRRQLLPHAVTGAVLGGGLAAQAVTASGVSPASAATMAAAVGFPAAAGAWKWVKSRRPRWARRVLLGGMFAAGWLTLAPFGVGPGDVALLLGAEYALAARWWQVNRLGYPDPVVVVDGEPVEKELTLAERIIADWDAFIAAERGSLPGSRLFNPRQEKHSIAFDLRVRRGVHTYASVMGALDKIGSGLDTDTTDLVVEPSPPNPQTGRRAPTLLRLQVVTESPIRGDVLFDGPRREGGNLHVGPYADGNGEAPWQLYTEDSMWGGVIIAGTGMGKSRVVENLAISAVSGGDTVIWFLDPQKGASSSALARYADWFADMDQAVDMREAATEIVLARSEENAVDGRNGFTPSAQRPGLLIFIEECHNPFKDDAAGWNKVAREGRKVGVAIVAISQYAGTVTFGGDEALRSSIAARNMIAMHVRSRSSGALIPGLPMDPYLLPDIAGYGVSVGAEAAGTRTAPFRNRLVRDAASWLDAQPRVQLDTLSATATLVAGTAYRDRHATAGSSRQASAARVEALRAGRLPDGVGGASKRQAEQLTPVGEMGAVVEFPEGITVVDLTAPAETPAAAARLELGASHRAVLNAVAVGKSRPMEIEQATGLSHRRVAELLKELVAAGHLVQPKYGRYQRVA